MPDDTRKPNRPVRAPRSHTWCFTSFEDAPPSFDRSMRYLVYQREQCPTTAKTHYQGYVEFTDAKALTQVTSILGKKCHVELRKGTQQQAIDYCKKKETAIPNTQKEFGIPAKPGNRSDLDNMFEMVRQGFTTIEMLYTFRGNGLRHLGVYQRAQAALFADMRNEIDRQLLYNRANGLALDTDLNSNHMENADNLRHFLRQTLDNDLNATVATEVPGNTTPAPKIEEPSDDDIDELMGHRPD